MKFEQLPPEFQAQAIAQGATPKKGPLAKLLGPGRRKYRNVPTVIGGHRFDSRHEAEVWLALCATYGAKNVIRQVSLPIGEKRIRPDFLIIRQHFPDGTFRAEFADAKGMITQEWKAKSNHLTDKHGLKIRLITKGKG